MCKACKGAAQLNLSPINIENIAIPVPSLANQEKNVNILNKFNNLTTNFQ
ncbi:restriction endonuclease subunit S [bacterium]|nr:restriction endonuclease subunit S [bacterium]